MNVKRRLFQEFGQLDNNRYYYANIHNEFYYGVSTLFHYKERSVWGDKDLAEEESFITTKIPEAVMVFLERFVQHVEEQGVEGGAMDFVKVREQIKEKMIDSVLSVSEPTPTVMMYLQKVSDSFYYDWTNKAVNAYLEGTGHWTPIYFEYNGLASRMVWLARSNGDVIDIINLKLFGKAEENEVTSLKRILLTADLVELFLDKISSGLPKSPEGQKEKTQ